MMRILTLFVLVLSICVSALARELTVDEKLADLQVLTSRIKSGYGPLQFKKSTFGIDVDALHQHYSAKIAASQTNGEFYYLLSLYIAEFKDGHFSARVPTDHQAALPFTVDLVEGRVLIDEINRTLLPDSKFPYVKGDEIVEFDGQLVMKQVEALKPYISMANPDSTTRLATMALTVRPGIRFPVPTNKKVGFVVRRGTSKVQDTVELEWKFSGTPWDEYQAPAAPSLMNSKQKVVFDYDELSATSVFESVTNPLVERTYRCNPGTRIEKPKDAVQIMSTPFEAYYYPTSAGNIGYLRIPHYVPDSFASGASTFQHYEYAVSVLEEKTVGLVIDQDHNCGGSVRFLHQLVSLFAEAEFAPMQFEMLASKEEALSYDSYVKASASNSTTLAYKNLEKVANLIKESWKKGLFLTPKTSISGEAKWTPHSIRYTKPIVVLADEVSGSGGDAFPSMMQGIGRAVLIGKSTMGLGGHVIELPPLYYSQLQPRITRSLFYRPDGVPVENNGAVPDIKYEPTRDDFMYGYRDYREFYTAELLKLIAANP